MNTCSCCVIIFIRLLKFGGDNLMKIVSSYKFKGNIIERNECRKKVIKTLRDSHEIKEIMQKVGNLYKNDRRDELKSLLLNELFFEEIEDFLLDEYINKLYSNNLKLSVNKSIEIYKKYAERGLIYTIDKATRG